MKALVFLGPGKFEFREVPRPEVGRGDVLVRVRAAGICGSELEAYTGVSKKRVPPLILGHELAGEVLEIGGDVSGVIPGERVVVQPLITCGVCAFCLRGKTNICPNRQLLSLNLPGGMAEFVSIPAEQVFPLPDTVSLSAGTLAEPLANGVHLLRRMGGVAHEPAVIYGGGAIGLLALAVLMHAGLKKIAVVEPNSARIELARRIGANRVFDPKHGGEISAQILFWSGDQGVATAVDAVGLSEARWAAVETAAPGGKIVCLGFHQSESAADHRLVVSKELDILGSYAYTNDDFRRAIALLDEGAVDAEAITMEAPFAEGPKCFQDLAEGRAPAAKVVLMME